MGSDRVALEFGCNRIVYGCFINHENAAQHDVEADCRNQIENRLLTYCVRQFALEFRRDVMLVEYCIDRAHDQSIFSVGHGGDCANPLIGESQLACTADVMAHS